MIVGWIAWLSTMITFALVSLAGRRMRKNHLEGNHDASSHGMRNEKGLQPVISGSPEMTAKGTHTHV